MFLGNVPFAVWKVSVQFKRNVEYNRNETFLMVMGSFTDKAILPDNNTEAASFALPLSTNTSWSRLLNLMSNNDVDLDDFGLGIIDGGESCFGGRNGVYKSVCKGLALLYLRPVKVSQTPRKETFR